MNNRSGKSHLPAEFSQINLDNCSPVWLPFSAWVYDLWTCHTKPRWHIRVPAVWICWHSDIRCDWQRSGVQWCPVCRWNFWPKKKTFFIFCINFRKKQINFNIFFQYSQFFPSLLIEFITHFQQNRYIISNTTNCDRCMAIIKFKT